LGQSEAGDIDAAMRGQPPAGGAVATADVDDALGRRQREPLGDETDERLGGFVRSLVPGAPVAMMDMFAPDAAIGNVELVLMTRDVGGRLRAVGIDHARNLWRAGAPGSRRAQNPAPDENLPRCRHSASHAPGPRRMAGGKLQCLDYSWRTTHRRSGRKNRPRRPNRA
jgi:hypothetical protein